MRHLLANSAISSGPVTCPGGPRYQMTAPLTCGGGGTAAEGMAYSRYVPLGWEPAIRGSALEQWIQFFLLRFSHDVLTASPDVLGLPLSPSLSLPLVLLMLFCHTRHLLEPRLSLMRCSVPNGLWPCLSCESSPDSVLHTVL